MLIPRPSDVSFFVHRALMRSQTRESQQDGAAMSFYEKGPVRIHFEEEGSGFPLVMIAGGGLNSAIPGRTCRRRFRSQSATSERSFKPTDQ